ncbi:RNA-binding protein RO60-like [Microplitis mediator]|uniref:RNA-binding protein RO60-like n=1 Tax=Microplitis mediator TaxID=375433 RepID=UPI0025527AF7|nr:RNA-binding protein RO60-like [Microplitis mediator]XP_057325069.1 RNA-binding protein RO60-like [Microplitis mediator]XP_057325070.1 RNA-binding protein RO60-like [Microplitis mediator]XP_057325071.1 RNA-binding protein RO60-like [Microplitis mediator]
MAVEVGVSVDDDNPKTRFVRYLYIGKEYPVYYSGTWSSQNHFTVDKVTSVVELAADKDTELYPITKIKQLLESGLVPKSETLMFALAVCARQEKSEKLRQAAYNFIAEECKNPEQFMLFIEYASQLSKQLSIPKHGYGHGWRNAVNKWYLSHDAKNLAECVTKYKSRHGWKHKDIIKLSHPVTKVLGSDIQAVFKYIMFGLEKAKSEFANEPKATEVLHFIERIDNFRQCQDPVEAAGLIRTYNYKLEHVQASLIKSSEVWEALIESMDLPNIVKNIQRIHNLGLLTPTSQLTEKVLSAITNKDQILRSKIRPAVILMAVKTYEDPDKIPVFTKRKLARKNKLRNRQLPNPDKRIVDALYSALNISFSTIEPTGLRFLITVSTESWKKKQITQVSVDTFKPWVLEAACIVALGLLRSEDKVTVSAFTATEGLNARPVHIDKNSTYQEAYEKMRVRSNVPPNLGKPILWAAHHRRKYDVFINVVDKMREKYDFTSRAMDLYKKKMNLPNTRLVNWVVGTTSTYMEGKYVNDVLTVCGFDIDVPKVIEAFAKRQF